MRHAVWGLALLPGCILYEAPDRAERADAALVPWDFDARVEVDAGVTEMACGPDLACPTASPGRVSVCGRLFDVETGVGIEAASPRWQACGSGEEATDGPCQLDIRFYDALDFAGNPNGATPLTYQTLLRDDCGRFVAHNVQRPSLGFLGIGVDDGAGQPDDHRLTGVAFAVSSGQVRSREPVFALQRATDTAWSAQAGLGASTFVDRGAILTLFTDDEGTPVPGVRVTSNGSVRAADDFYYSDLDPKTRATVDPSRTTTGPNGASLMLNSSLVEHSGAGGEPAGCSWSSGLAASIPGVLFVQRTILESNSTGGSCAL